MLVAVCVMCLCAIVCLVDRLYLRAHLLRKQLESKLGANAETAADDDEDEE
jgi:hypothetical protein